MCCAEAGVAVQLRGHIYGLPLNTGHYDDTCFIEDICILDKQRQFAENDTSSVKPFMNVFDKGYQCLLDALLHGQSCLQPAFAESEKQFKDNAVLHSGAVAVVRSGNERAVNRCKMSRFLKRGSREQRCGILIWSAMSGRHGPFRSTSCMRSFYRMYFKQNNNHLYYDTLSLMVRGGHCLFIRYCMVGSSGDHGDVILCLFCRSTVVGWRDFWRDGVPQANL